MAATQITGANIKDGSLDVNTETTGTLSIARGGTGAITAPLARASLGVLESVAVGEGLSVSTANRVSTIAPLAYGNLQNTDAVILPAYPKGVPSGVFTLNQMRLALIVMPVRILLRRLSFSVAVAGGAGSTAEVALYDQTFNQVITTGALSVTTPGRKRQAAPITGAYTVPGAAYYVAAIASDTTVQLGCQDTNDGYFGTGNLQTYHATVASGVLPANSTGVSFGNSTLNNYFLLQLETA